MAININNIVDSLQSQINDVTDNTAPLEIIKLLKASKNVQEEFISIANINGIEGLADALALKLNVSDFETQFNQQFTAANILTLLKTVDGISSGLDADTLDGYDAGRFIKNDIANSKFYNFEILSVDDIYAEELNYNNRIMFDVQSSTPKITIRKYDELQDFEEALVYTDKNTSNVMIIREGYFKGLWEPTFNITFGISNWNEYNWTVSVTPTVIGFEHDYNATLNHTPFSGFDTDNIWDQDDSEYHYAYIQNNVVRLESIHRIGNSVVDIPARYHLIGVLKSFSSYAQVNQI